jgi:hypothetical protein
MNASSAKMTETTTIAYHTIIFNIQTGVRWDREKG